MNIAIFAYSRTGCKTARRICMALPEAETLCYAVPRLAEPGFLPLEKAVYGAAFWPFPYTQLLRIMKCLCVNSFT